MTKQELSRYFWLCHEIEKQKKRLEKLQAKRANSGGFVGDSVKDYRSGRGVPLKIQGYAEEDYTLPNRISTLEEEIEHNIAESDRLAAEIEIYIQSIDDPKMREIMRCRFLDCMGWSEVGKENFMDPDHARRLVREFLRRSK
ncbi:MAG: hypothetical protein PUK54_11530 [Firmicutes bacterium]|nr:hypothetical protein [Bacillota bacterium]